MKNLHNINKSKNGKYRNNTLLQISKSFNPKSFSTSVTIYMCRFEDNIVEPKKSKLVGGLSSLFKFGKFWII